MAWAWLGAFAVAALSLIAFSCDSEAAKILLVPMFGGSHYLLFLRIGEELGDRGHEVTMLVPSSQRFKPSEKVAIKQYSVPYKPGFEEKFITENLWQEEDSKKKTKSFFDKLNAMGEVNDIFCKGFLSFEGLKDLKPDILVGDSHFSCSGAVMDYLEVKFVLVCPSGLANAFLSLFKNPNSLSYAPQPYSGLDDKMTFGERLTNILTCLVVNVAGRVFLFPDVDRENEEFDIKPVTTTADAFGRAEVVLVQSHFALDFARPLTPAVVVTGPILPKPANPLSEELEKFMASSGDSGVIVVSFGSMLSALPPTTMNILASVLGRLKQKVLWKVKGSLLKTISPNIKTVDWIPQNDVLGHAKTKVFLTHLGHNSMYEAAYHGVPTVGFPMWTDQPGNARQITRAGMGLWVNIDSVTEEELYDTVTKVINDPSFKNNATRVSRLIRDQPRTPLELTADWIEYVLRHDGAPHLRVEAFNMPWYQEYMLDVALFLLIIAMCVFILIKLLCRCLCKVCCVAKEEKNKEE